MKRVLEFGLLLAVSACLWWLLSSYAPGVAVGAVAAARSFPFICANCHADLAVGRRKRRRVPRLGGKPRVVCLTCAAEIDAQGTLTVAAPEQRQGSRIG